ncbi:hypothetical protein C2845_PM04G23260 [Panicum miliaceum]|uniref:Uncharacterized protein n=1 Tax=Panicum miliaceum TaxID=4540 RepID=A0A3L6QUU8_PANMI|nr:hypothetical protein C2845_PM04G23260 [Panicum miliaceum]
MDARSFASSSFSRGRELRQCGKWLHRRSPWKPALWSQFVERDEKKWPLAAPSSHLPSLSSGGAASESESRGGEGAGGGSEARGGGADSRNDKLGTCHSLANSRRRGGGWRGRVACPGRSIPGCRWRSLAVPA